MTAPRVRIDHDQMQAIAAQWRSQAEAVAALIALLKQSYEPLKAGDWTGAAARHFFTEMDGAVFPTLTRLQAALETSAQVTDRLRTRMRVAEEDAARVLRPDRVETMLARLSTVAGMSAAERAAFQEDPPEWWEELGAWLAEAATDVAESTAEWLDDAWGFITHRPLTSVTAAQAEAIYADMADEAHIPFAYPVDGCYARADEMVRLMVERYNIDPTAIKKVLVIGDPALSGDLAAATDYDYSLYYPGSFTTDGRVRWDYHIAPALPIEGEDGTISYVVIDPSIAEGPLSPEDWANLSDDPGLPGFTHSLEIVDASIYGYNIRTQEFTIYSAEDAAYRTEVILNAYLEECRLVGFCK